MKIKNIVFNPITNIKELREIDVSEKLLEEIKEEKQLFVMELYKNAITKGFYSSATGEELFYGYNTQDQLNYSKWANILSLDIEKETVRISSTSKGVVQLTREQFLQFCRDCENHEMVLFQKRVDLIDRINKSTSLDELESIPIAME